MALSHGLVHTSERREGAPLTICVHSSAPPSSRDVLEFVDSSSGETQTVTGIGSWAGNPDGECAPDSVRALVQVRGEIS